MLLIVSILCFARTAFDKSSYGNNKQIRQEAQNILREYEQASRNLEEQKRRDQELETKIENHFERYKGRDTIVELQDLVISVLPNKENTPQQAEVFDAFNSGNAKKLIQTPRDERKLLFAKTVSIEYSEDISQAQFNKNISRRTDIKAESGRGAGGYEGMGMPGMMGPGMMGPGGYGGYQPRGREDSRRSSRRDSGRDQEDKGIESGPGFIISIVGYSPYRNIGDLIDPAGVGDDKSKWGVVTRLANLDEIIDGNSPYQLFKKTDIKHFNLDTGEIDLEKGDVPKGIGVKGWMFETPEGEKLEGKENNQQVLRDPMTNEIISKIPVLDEKGEKVIKRGKVVYEVKDHWYKLDFKLLWNKANKKNSEPGRSRR
jgi:hypothetical protein